MLKLEEVELNERFSVEGSKCDTFECSKIKEKDIDELVQSRKIVNGRVERVLGNGDAIVRFESGLTAVCPYDETDIRDKKRLSYIRRMIGENFDFLINGRNENGEIVLSRKEIQKEVVEYLKHDINPGTILNGKVVGMGEHGIYFDIGRGIRGFLDYKDEAINRHCRKYSIGDEIPVVFRGICPNYRALLSTVELYGDWEQNEEVLDMYEARIGVVKTVSETGAFIAVSHNLTGLADVIDGFDLESGDVVSVVIRGKSKEKMRIKLMVVKKLDKSNNIEPHMFTRSGRIVKWEYAPENYIGNKRTYSIDYEGKSSILEFKDRQDKKQDEEKSKKDEEN